MKHKLLAVILPILFAVALRAQVTIDFSQAAQTTPWRFRADEPGTCRPGEIYRNLTTDTLRICHPGSPPAWADLATGGGGGGSANNAPQVLYTNSSTLTVGANCTVAAPCNVGYASPVILTSSATITAPTGAGTVYVWVPAAGGYSVAVSGSLAATCTGCTIVAGTSFPAAKVARVWTWTSSFSGSWDINGGTNAESGIGPPAQSITSSVCTITDNGNTVDISNCGGSGSSIPLYSLDAVLTAASSNTAIPASVATISAANGLAVVVTGKLQQVTGTGGGIIRLNWVDGINSRSSSAFLVNLGGGAGAVGWSSIPIFVKAGTSPSYDVYAITSGDTFELSMIVMRAQ